MINLKPNSQPEPEPQPVKYPKLRNVVWSSIPIEEALRICRGSMTKESDRPDAAAPPCIPETTEMDPRRMTVKIDPRRMTYSSRQDETLEMPDFDNQMEEAHYRRKIVGTISGLPVLFSRKLSSSSSKSVYAVEVHLLDGHLEPYAMAINKDAESGFCRESGVLVNARLKGAVTLTGPFPFIDNDGKVYEAALMRGWR